MSLAINNLSRSFGGFRAVDDVSLKFCSGCLDGIIGPNGAGKSTLFAMISGFITPSSGTIHLDGNDITHRSAVTRAQAGMIKTFQVPREFSNLTVRDNLMAAAPNQTGDGLFGLFCRPFQVRREEQALAEKVEETLKFLKLDGVASQAAGRLSGGQKKLLELGRALMVNPKLILLDEPFAGVNPVLIEAIMERVRELNRRGIGFLIIEHDLSALTNLVGRLAVMVQGRVLADGEPGFVLDLPKVRDAYLGGGA